MRELKRALRKELIQKRREMPREKKLAADRDIFEQVKPLCENAGAVFTYVSTEIEVDTRQLIGFCLDSGIPVAVPVSGDSELTFFYINSVRELSEGRYGILEPTDRSRQAFPDERTLCIVPALCADGKGLRLGYGKGYYDRFLSRFCGTSVILCYSDFVREVPAEPHDIKAQHTIINRR
ncbi:MAG: 5-formyltetrahydrofolate cyclo-ligase [Oscillospiraceae bacterium]